MIYKTIRHPQLSLLIGRGVILDLAPARKE